MPNDRHFAELVSVACHDILTPLATVYGFARTLEQLPLEDPAPRYVEMVAAASAQIDELVDQLRLVARIESGRFEPALAVRDSLELAREAAGRLEEGRLDVTGEGAPVSVDPEPTARALSQLARATARFGGHDSVAARGARRRSSSSRRSPAPPARSSSARRPGSWRRRRPPCSCAPSAASSRPGRMSS